MKAPLAPIIVFSLFFFLSVPIAVGQEANPPDYVGVGDEVPRYDENEPEVQSDHSVMHSVLMYLPNRVFDLIDIFRARVRVGPGIAAGFRVTEMAQLNVGAYGTIYAGLPGPRQRVFPKLPMGLEAYTGIAVSVLDASVGGGVGPDYSPTEVGVGVQLGIVGADAGFDPVELVDFFAGLALIDIRDDDF